MNGPIRTRVWKGLAMEKVDIRKILDLAHELQALSSAGLSYSKSPFDKERYVRIRDISAELISSVSDEPIEKVKRIFEENSDYQTPKISTRAAIFNENEEVLLVRDYDNKWVMPGGWCDYDQTIMSNTMKEVAEEAGLVVHPYRLVGLFDHHKRNNPSSFFYCVHAFFLCYVIAGEFRGNIETSESRYFSVNDLPELNDHKTSKEEIMTCLDAFRVKEWEPIVD